MKTVLTDKTLLINQKKIENLILDDPIVHRNLCLFLQIHKKKVCDGHCYIMYLFLEIYQNEELLKKGVNELYDMVCDSYHVKRKNVERSIRYSRMKLFENAKQDIINEIFQGKKLLKNEQFIYCLYDYAKGAKNEKA